MFKIIRRKKWKEVIERAELDIALLEIKIETHQDIIRDYNNAPKTLILEAPRREKARLESELPFLYDELERKKKFLRELRGI